MSEPHITAIRDQLKAECANYTAEELIHALAGTLRLALNRRLHPPAFMHDDPLRMADATFITLTEMITGWLGGPHHTCVHRHADSPFDE